MGKRSAGRMLAGVLALLAMLLALTAGAAEGETPEVDTVTRPSMNIQNGGFEDGQKWTNSFLQLDQEKVPKWYTSAFEGKIELFRENKSTYISGVTLTPAEGTYAAELNADEESTLYQALNTQPSSIYEWSLSHGARTSADTMALIVGPNQSIRDTNESTGFRCLLSKPDKDGRDQFMQMIDWLKAQENSGRNYQNGLYNGGEPIVLYSKKFAENGTFQDNAGGEPFSLTPSPFYTQKWLIWLMKTEKKVENNCLKWSTYGSKAENVSENENSGLAEAYYRYTVPTGQRQTLFGFVSIATQDGKDNTYGNFLDGISFTIYHPLTANTTPHGSAVIISALDGKEAGRYQVEPAHGVDTYVQHGVELNLEVAEPAPGVTFAGVYYTKSDGTSVFIPNRANEQGNNPWTWDEIKKQFTYETDPVETGVELYFVFIKSPMITYDPNGGDPYDCGQKNSGEAANVYSFKPQVDENGVPVNLVPPYTAHAAIKTTDGTTIDTDWLFTGWRLSDDNNTEGTDGKPLILPDVHTVACNYDSLNQRNQQPFVIIEGNNTFIEQKDAQNKVTGWSAPDGVTPLYDKDAMGLTLVAQWKWRQTFIPCVKNGNAYNPSEDGGTVTIIGKTGTPVDPCGTSYFAQEQETITVTATAKPGYAFEGWYDGDELKAIEPELTYEVGKGEVRKYYARFASNVTQTYIRQIPTGPDSWTDVAESDTTVPALDHYELKMPNGTAVTCTPITSADDRYSFEGWYTKEDDTYTKVDGSLVKEGTLGYTVNGNATYYARFIPRARFVVRYVDDQGNVTAEPLVPNELVCTTAPTEKSAMPGDSISSTATAGTGYVFRGWYDSDGAERQLLTESVTYSTTMPVNGGIYYALFAAGNNSKYAVQHILVKPDGSTSLYRTDEVSSVPTGTPVHAEYLTDIPGYTGKDTFKEGSTTYTSNKSGYVRGDGTLVLRLYYQADSNISFRIEHYQVDVNGIETLYTTTDGTGKTDEKVIGKVHDAGIVQELIDLGYALDENYPKSVLEGSVSVSPMLVLKLYYVRTPHKVTFNMHGHGSPVKEQIVPHMQTATRPANDPAELGYVFEGWYTDDTYGQVYNFDDPVTDDITIHAKWSKPWTVSFDMQGHGDPGPAAQKVPNGGHATDPTPNEADKPTAEGYIFKGWYTDADCTTEFNFTGTAILKDTTVYAKWLANVTVTKVWDNAGASEIEVLLLRDGQPVMEDDPGNPGTQREAVRVLKADQTNVENNWKAAWTGLPDTGRYTVQELNIPKDCTAVYSSTGDNQFVITNIGDRQISVTVKNTHSVSTIGMTIRKEWDDANNRNRPGSIRVQIKNADTGEVVQGHELNAGNDWTWTVTGLNKYHDGGKLMRYVVDEAGVNAGYMVSCDVVMEQDGSYTVKLTNVLTGKMDIGGTKAWNDGGNRDGLRPDSLYLSIYQNSIIPENLVQVIQVEPEAGDTDSWGWTVKDLPVYDSFGRPITYIVVEDPVPEGYADPGPIFIPAASP